MFGVMYGCFVIRATPVDDNGADDEGNGAGHMQLDMGLPYSVHWQYVAVEATVV